MPKGVYIRTKEDIEKRRNKMTGNKIVLGKHWKVKDTSKYIGNHNGSGGKGRKLSEEHKKKIGLSNKGKNLGKRHTEETKKKMSEAQRAEKNHNWQGGKSFEPYSSDWIETVKNAIRERDGDTCRLCGKRFFDEWVKRGRKKAFPVHHIDYDKKNCNPDNLITLCVQCHTKTNYRRNYWKNYFKKL
jgi:5-methylcytosine-specific restriction endonuclease McrA